MSAANGIRLNVVVGYLPDWSPGSEGTSLALTIQGNDPGLRYLIDRLEVMIMDQGTGSQIDLIDSDHEGISVEPRSMRIQLHKL